MAIFDEGGLDLAQVVAGQVLAPAFGERFAVPATVTALIERGRLGRRTNHGFYDWRGGRPVDGTRVDGSPVRSATVADREHLAADLEAAVVGEAARLLDEGVATAPDIDLLAVGCARIFPVELTGPCAQQSRWGAA
jgi:3-hydroxyacyl-CoA dehydrogenase